MDNNDNKDTTFAPPVATPGAVMDIQPPRPITSAPPLNDNNEAETELAQAPDETLPEEAETTVEPEQVAPVVTEETLVPANSSTHPVTPNPLAIPEIPAHIKKNTPVVPIVVAILIALALAGATVFAYMKTKDNTKDVKETSNSTSPLAGKKITQSDIDAENKKIEEDLKAANEELDFAAADLTDQSLGL